MRDKEEATSSSFQLSAFNFLLSAFCFSSPLSETSGIPRAEFFPFTFRMDTIHGSIDNATQRIRLSTDTRYQRSDEPVDERWVGENPIGHGPDAKIGRIC